MKEKIAVLRQHLVERFLFRPGILPIELIGRGDQNFRMAEQRLLTSAAREPPGVSGDEADAVNDAERRKK